MPEKWLLLKVVATASCAVNIFIERSNNDKFEKQ